MKNPLLSLHNIDLTLSGKTILSQINLDLHAGEITTLIGPNGAGKSSLVRIALGLIKASKGKITRQSGLRLGYMPQKLVIENNLPLSVLRFMQLAYARTSKDEALAALQRFECSHLAEHPIQKLSGGEFQRVLLARTILREPQLLVLDEPAQGVDINGQRELYRLIKQVRDETQCAVLMVSHDLHLVMKSTDHVICLNTHICCAGHPDNISQHPAYLNLFGSSIEDELAVYTHHHDHHHDLSGEAHSHCMDHN